MKVNINMTINVSEEDRIAVSYRNGSGDVRPASREDIKRYLRAYLRGALSDLDSPPDAPGGEA